MDTAEQMKGDKMLDSFEPYDEHYLDSLTKENKMSKLYVLKEICPMEYARVFERVSSFSMIVGTSEDHARLLVLFEAEDQEIFDAAVEKGFIDPPMTEEEWNECQEASLPEWLNSQRQALSESENKNG
jgi:hypothetical protein